MRRIVFFLILFAASIPAFAENIYVSQNGTGNGSSCSNARSASWFNTSGNWGSGAGQINSGDIVYLCGTITNNLVMQGSGTSGNIITIDGSNATLSGVFTGTDRHYWKLQNATWSGSLTTSYIITFTRATHVELNNINLPSYEGGSGLYFYGGSYITVDGLSANNLRYGLIDFQPSLGNQVHDVVLRNLDITTTNDYMPSTQRDVIRGCAHDVTIEKSYFNKRWSSQNDAYSGSRAHNDIWQFWGSSSNPDCVNPYNMTIRYSYLITDVNYDGNFQFLMWEGTQGTLGVYSNVFIKKGTNGDGAVLSLKNPLSGTTLNVYNNTFVMKDRAPWYFLGIGSLSYGSTVNFMNNIVYNTDTSFGIIEKPSSGTFIHRNNTYYGGPSNGYLGMNCESYITTGEVCNSNPQFYDYSNDDFRIGPNSSAYNTGTDLGSEYNMGLSTSSSSFLKPNPMLIERPQGTQWDRGAYEYIPAGSKVPLAPSILAIN